MINLEKAISYTKLIDNYHKLRSSNHYSNLNFEERVQTANELMDGLKHIDRYHYRRPLDAAGHQNTGKLNGSGWSKHGVVNLASNDYLGFTKHDEILKACCGATEKFGSGSGSVPMLSGTLTIHKALENALAEFTNYEAALLLNSCFVVNYGLLSALLTTSDVAILDTYVHASIIDGCCKTNKVFFNHNDPDSLKSAMIKASRYKNKLVIIEGVYSMDGDIAKLSEIVTIAKENGAWVMLDESHALGVIGQYGKGTQSHLKIHEKADIITGSMGKALGGIGGYLAGTKKLVDLMEITNRPFIYSTSIPPSVVAGLIKAIELLKKDDLALYRLRENIKYFRENIKEVWPTLGALETPVFPLIISNEEKLANKCKKLQEEGIFVNPIFYPVVPRRKARIRISITASLTKPELDYALDRIMSESRNLI